MILVKGMTPEDYMSKVDKLDGPDVLRAWGATNG